MQENKNLVEEALIQMKNVEEAIAEKCKRNTCFYYEGRNQPISKRISF